MSQNLSFTSKKGSSNLQWKQRSVTSKILSETNNHRLEVFPNLLPVAVNEILTLAENPSDDISVRVSSNGWAWLVCGRRLVTWRYASGTVPGGGRNCRELTLPPTDLCHKAQLVNVVTSNVDTSQTPFCIAATPEGLVRYWPSVAHESAWIEERIGGSDMQGQECCLLTDAQPIACILATTTSTVAIISPATYNGQHALSYRILKVPQGLMGGISRRFSTLLWGSLSSTSAGHEKLVGILSIDESDDSDEKSVFVLTHGSGGLQKWILVSGEPDAFIYECDIETLAKTALIDSKALDATETARMDSLKIWFVDIQECLNGISILIAAMNPCASRPVLQFALGTLTTLSNAPPRSFRSFIILKEEPSVICPEARNVSLDSESFRTNYRRRFICHPNDQYYYLYENSLISIVDSRERDNCESVDYNFGTILGAGFVQGLNLGYDFLVPVFFCLKNGLVALVPISTDFNNSKALPSIEEPSEAVILSQNPISELSINAACSFTDHLKAAFLHYCRKESSQCRAIVNDLFSASAMTGSSVFDRDVLTLAMNIIDDYPASDPRWVQSLPSSEMSFAGSSMSLVVLHQLEDKQAALNFYINFLKDERIWNKLKFGTDQKTPTWLTLNEYAEKTVFAIALRNQHCHYQDLVDASIKLTLEERGTVVSPSSGLTHQDHFYREISRIDEIFAKGFQKRQSQILSSGNFDPQSFVLVDLSINKLILTLLKEALAYRVKKHSEDFDAFKQLEETGIEFSPWTAESSGMRSHLKSQYLLTLEKAVPLAADEIQQKEMYAQLVELADIVLDGYEMQISSIKDSTRKDFVTKLYEKDRFDLIIPFVSNGYYDEGASLAEKFKEYGVLVRLCQATNDHVRLDRYMEVFPHDFAAFVFDWHMRHGQQGQLLASMQDGPRKCQNLALTSFLTNGGHDDIAWLHGISTGGWSEASETLARLARKETTSLTRKKTMLSLAKLTALSCDDIVTSISDIESDNHLSYLASEMDLVLTQEQLPNCLVQKLGFDHVNDLNYVLTPTQLIQLYVSDDNKEANDLDFKKALDILSHVFDDEKDHWRLFVWVKALLRNDWNSIDIDNPLGPNGIGSTLFFRLVEFCSFMGIKPPSVERLLEDEELPETMAKDPNFQFLLRAGYEHYERMQV